MDRLRFYLTNATIPLLRERRRAISALFTVMMGVAAIVGLQLTADILERSLTTNVRALLRRDIAVGKSQATFESEELTAIQAVGRQYPIRICNVDTLSLLGQPSGTMSRGRSSPGSSGGWVADA